MCSARGLERRCAASAWCRYMPSRDSEAFAKESSISVCHQSARGPKAERVCTMAHAMANVVDNTPWAVVPATCLLAHRLQNSIVVCVVVVAVMLLLIAVTATALTVPT